MSTKYCKHCNTTKPIERFSKKGEGRASKCKDCHNLYVKEVWYKKNADSQKAASARWKSENKARVLATRYGCDVGRIEELLDIGSCQICGSTENLNIDHCHDTLEVRGILCGYCNRGLGHFKDDHSLLTNAAEYIQHAR